MRVLLVTDGIPGHENQARGLCQWLSRRYQVELQTLSVTLRFKALSRLLLPHFTEVGPALARRLFNSCYGGDLPPEQAPDLVLSAGGNTSFANILLRRYYGCPNIFIGSRRRLNAESLVAHLTLEPTGDDNNIVMTVSPNLVDREQVAQAGQDFIAQQALEQPLWGLVIGGDGAGFHYTEADWLALAEWANKVALARGVRWLVSSSRRTGALGESVLRTHMLAQTIGYAIWWHSNPEKKLAAIMGASERLVVTADSMSMINEAMASGSAVTVLALPKHTANARYCNAIDGFEAAGLCTRVQLGEEPGEAAFGAATPDMNPSIESVLDRLDYLLKP